MRKKLFMIGMWHLGCVTAGCMNKLGHSVTCFDFDKKVIDDLKIGKLPIYEQGLQELFEGISFTSDISDCKDSDFIFITYDINVNGITLEPLLIKLIEQLKPYMKGKILVVRSQVALGSCDRLARELGCKVCYFPENLRLGTAVHNFLNPDWLVFGLSSLDMTENIAYLFVDITCKEMTFLSLEEAEMVKMSMNCYLATLISMANEISDLCEQYNIDAKAVLKTLKLDKRVSPFAPIMPGLAISGGTIERDLNSMRKLGHAAILDAVALYNTQRGLYIQNRLERLLGGLNGKTITFFGATYKTGTDTLRDSPTLKEIAGLEHNNVVVKVFDPLIKTGVPHQITSVLEAKGSDAIVIMTDWSGWKNIDYALLAPKVILDTKGTLPSRIKHFEIGV